jgi:ribonuclease BN (tRNA processing enzyme)
MDHVFGLTYLWGAFMKYQVQQMGSDPLPDFQTISDRINQMMRQVHIHATVDVLQGVEKNLGLWSDLQYVTLNDIQVLPGDGTLKVFPVEHGVPCFGFRLEWPGHSLAYVTDTIVRADSPYIEHLKGVDLLLHDAYMPDQWADVARLTNHSHTSGAAQVAAQARVGRLLLIHHNTGGMRVAGAELAAARAIFPATEVGLDKMEIDF